MSSLKIGLVRPEPLAGSGVHCIFGPLFLLFCDQTGKGGAESAPGVFGGNGWRHWKEEQNKTTGVMDL
ncbi:hypothetical protein PPACK8108_LOCUS22524 [Phakopsora pachyrhizi]|uniref:Uncharacterized protein n=1 Tax=Phakopsora pachyrhizi TaxID=170000 RepID=A0AAV0BMU7_PHAPC|nr:hypothetical protein PPACK8108_LOCUS22524 [Phakopsora pachyrhizi]